MMSGAIARCRRSSRFASRNIETVTPPPSTKIRGQPRARSTRSSSATSSVPAARPAPASSPRMAAQPKWLSARPRQRSRADIQRLRGVVAEDAMVAAKPPCRVEDHAQRVGTGDQARGELRIVGRDGSGADDDGVAQRAQAMQVEDVFLAGDPARFTGVGRDEAVEALAQVADGDRPAPGGAADGEIEIDERMARIVRRPGPVPIRRRDATR